MPKLTSFLLVICLVTICLPYFSKIWTQWKLKQPNSTQIRTVWLRRYHSILTQIIKRVLNLPEKEIALANRLKIN